VMLASLVVLRSQLGWLTPRACLTAGPRRRTATRTSTTSGSTSTADVMPSDEDLSGGPPRARTRHLGIKSPKCRLPATWDHLAAAGFASGMGPPPFASYGATLNIHHLRPRTHSAGPPRRFPRRPDDVGGIADGPALCPRVRRRAALPDAVARNSQALLGLGDR